MLAERGGNFKAHIPWQVLDEKVLTIMKTLRTRKKLPGSTWYPDWYYRQTHGEFNAESMAAGHRPFENDGKAGYMVPDAPVVKFRAEGIYDAQLSQVYTAKDELDPSLLGQVGADFVNSAFGAPLPSSFSGTDLQDKFDEDADEDGPRASGVPAPSTLAHSRVHVTPVAQQPKPAPNPKVKAGTKLVLPGEQQQQQAQPKTEQQAAGGAVVKTEPGQAASASGTPSKASRGRKPKAWANLVDIEINSFSNANEHSSLWNGSEITTAMKNLASLEKDTHTCVYVYVHPFHHAHLTPTHLTYFPTMNKA